MIELTEFQINLIAGLGSGIIALLYYLHLVNSKRDRK